MLLAALGAFLFAPVPMCPTRTWLHVPCPGCGVTRAVLLAARGDLHASLHMHPLAIPAAVLMVPTLFVLARSAAHHDAGPSFPRPLRLAWGAFVVLLVVLWIARFFGAFGGPAPI